MAKKRGFRYLPKGKSPPAKETKDDAARFLILDALERLDAAKEELYSVQEYLRDCLPDELTPFWRVQLKRFLDKVGPLRTGTDTYVSEWRSFLTYGVEDNDQPPKKTPDSLRLVADNAPKAMQRWRAPSRPGGSRLIGQ
jgi:hypothetical protein